MSVLQLTNLSKQEQEAKMESLIEEFSLGHIRTNREIYFQEGKDVLKLRAV